jgi:predicted Zn-dependent protease with MMP-like domain/Flp pilus assembly protein TadD
MGSRDRAAEEAARLVDEAATLFEAGALDDALARAEQATALAPRAVAAQHWRAAALAELGRTDEARAAYDAALRVGPDDLDLLAGAAEFFVRAQEPGGDADREAIERGLELARRGGRIARREDEPGIAAELALLEGVALSQLGELGEALARLDAAIAASPDRADALVERGNVLYELCRFDDARRQLLEALARDPDDAWAHHLLGLVAERQGDAKEARRRSARARKLAPDDFPSPVELSAAAFDAAVEDALAALPEPVRAYLSNVAIAVEELPSDDDLLGTDPPLSPSILGVFRGAPLGQKASMDPWSHFPSSIVLYQRNLERFARDRAELIDEIRVTLLHEVGHFLGLDEDDLWERGLD